MEETKKISEEIKTFLDDKSIDELTKFIETRMKFFFELAEFRGLKKAGCTFGYARDDIRTCRNFVWRNTTIVINLPPVDGKIVNRYLCAYLLDSNAPYYKVFVSVEEMKYFPNGAFDYAPPRSSELNNQTVSDSIVLDAIVKELNLV